MSEEIKEEAVESEAQMTPEEVAAAVEDAAKTFLDMIAKANETLKSVTEVGEAGLDGVDADIKQAAQAIGATVEKVSSTAKEMADLFPAQEEASEAEAAEGE